MKHRVFSLKPDYDLSGARYDAFWERDGSERSPVCITFPREGFVYPKIRDTVSYKSEKERWTDIEYRAEADAAWIGSREYYADSMPIVWPNLGPEIFSSWCGCGYGFTSSTTWSVPCIKNFEDIEHVKLDKENYLFKLTEKYTDLLIEYGKGKFIVGLTDFHPGGDHLAALRDPERLAVDLLENPDEVKKLMKSSTTDYFNAYRHFADKIIDADMPLTSWTPLISDEYFYIPSCDFSCMVSTEMFEEFFLPAIIEECKFMKHSIYHLDGPDALRHLDSLLAIKELDAIQWVPTYGKSVFSQTLDIYKKVQAAGKGIQLSCDVSQLDTVFEVLSPKGVWFAGLDGIANKEEADKALKRIENWK